MIIEKRVKDFEKLGFGMFVHFGLYSLVGKGEWYKHIHQVSDEAYMPLAKEFNPDKDWAKQLAATAKAAGCKYITLTTRHHDGYSLYDTCGLNDYDAPHSCGRDLVKEFVDACNAEGIVPFFYHTYLDWYEKTFDTDFKTYLQYLRESVKLLCTNYGKIGGIWFDGKWSKPNEDWEEDELYGMIRKYQPDAIIVNNTGLGARGALGHIELDSVTFERGRPGEINLEDSPKYIASEMCQVFNEHWGYAENDFNYKSLGNMIEDLCVCRRYGANFLLNVGPMGNGLLRPLDKAMMEELGRWVKLNEEGVYLPRPCKIEVINKPADFLLEKDGAYYLFCHNLSMSLAADVAISKEVEYVDSFKIPKKIKSVVWLDEPQTELGVEQKGEDTTIYTMPYRYGTHLAVRVAKILTE